MSLSFDINKAWTSAQIKAEEEKFKKDLSRYNIFNNLFRIVIIVASVLAFSNPFNWSYDTQFISIFTVVLIVLFSSLIHWEFSVGFRILETEFNPVSSKDCVKLLGWANDYPEVSAYRDMVISEAREFTVKEVEELDAYIATIPEKEACKQLYKITA